MEEIDSMKLAFSTLGCPEWALDTVLQRAVEYGYTGVDIRGIGSELDVYRLPEFSGDAEKTASRFRDRGVQVSCFSTSIHLLSGPRADAWDEFHRYAELCALFETPGLRVFGGDLNGRSREDGVQVAAEFLHELAEAAEEYDLGVWVETHDDWTSSEHVKMLLDAVNHPRVGVVWDMFHTWRDGQEPLAKSQQLLGSKIVNTHWKDAVSDPVMSAGYRYCLPGDREFDFQEAAGCLTAADYAGWYTLEWEKRWHSSLPDPEVSFPHYVRLMREIRQHMEPFLCAN